jgi:hypothetical protein
LAALFRTRQPFLQTNAWQNQAINALHYNTSQQGSVVPLIYGTVRQAVNLVDFQDYRGPSGGKGKTGSLPVTGTQSRSAKGGGSKSGKKSTPDYTIDVMFAVGMGPMTGIGQVYSSSGIASFGSLPLNFYSGADGQAADTTFAGFGSVVGYSGTAMVSGTPLDLGPSPVLPNIAVEAMGFEVGINTGSFSSDANPANVIKDFLTNSRYGVGFPSANLADLTTLTGSSFAEYCQAAPLLISVSLDGHQKAIEWLDSIAKLCNSAMVFSGRLLQFIPFGDLALSNNDATWTPNLVPVYNLTDRHFLPWRQHELGREPSPGDDDPILLTRTNAADAYNWRSIEYTDRNNFYNSTTLTVDDQGLTDTYGLRIGDSIQGRAFCNITSAQISAQLTIQRDEYIRNTPYRFQIGWQYARMIPMDIVTLTGRYADLYLNEQPVRVLSIEEDEQGGLTVEAEEIQTGVSAPPIVLPTFDGGGGIGALGPTSITISGINTTKSNDILILMVALEQTAQVGGPSPPAVGSVSSSPTALSWTLRSGPTVINPGSTGCGLFPPCSMSVYTYWAHAASPLVGESITVTIPGGCATAIACMAAFNGINTSSPWDPNGSLPKVAVYDAPTQTRAEVTGVSTSHATDVLLSFGVAFTAPNMNVNYGPWSFAGSSSSQAIQVFVGLYTTGGIFYNVVSSQQSGATFPTQTDSAHIYQCWVVVADALRGA